MRVRPAGNSALLIECHDGEQVEAWRAELWRRRAAGELTATEIVPGARTILLDGVDPALDISVWLPDQPPLPTPASSLVEIPATFDGPDLSDIAEHWRVDVDTAVQRLTGTSFTVAFCGFAPGFAYLRGLPAAWSVPRLAAPRPRVPAGAIGLADTFAGIYPSASPGGWRLAGRTEVTLFDVRAEPPALLTPGTRVHLVAT